MGYTDTNFATDPSRYAFLFNESEAQKSDRYNSYYDKDATKKREYNTQWNMGGLDLNETPEQQDAKKASIFNNFKATLDNPNNTNDAMIFDLLNQGISYYKQGMATDGKHAGNLSIYAEQRKTEDMIATNEGNRNRDMQRQSQKMKLSGGNSSNSQRTGAVGIANNQTTETNKLGGNSSPTRSILGG